MPKTGIRSYETKTKGRLWMAYYDRDGRKVLRRGFRTSRAAERWRADALINATSPADSTITVEKWLGQWLYRHRENIAASTYERYEGVIRNWIVPNIGPIRLATLTHRHVEGMYRRAREENLSPSSIRQNHAPLRSALGEAVRDGLIPHNPATLVKLPRLGQPPIEPFTYEEQVQFLSGNRDRELYPVYHMALHSGMRLGEIMALRVKRDIDLETRSVFVRETRRANRTGPPKSRGSRRRVILGAAAAEMLAGVIEDKWSACNYQIHNMYVLTVTSLC